MSIEIEDSPQSYYLQLFTCNYVVSVGEVSSSSLGAWDGLRYSIVALIELSI